MARLGWLTQISVVGLGNPELTNLERILLGVFVFTSMLLGLALMAYFAWFRWEDFARFLISSNRYNPLFEYYEELYLVVSKWYCRILAPPMFLVILYIVIRIIIQVIR